MTTETYDKIMEKLAIFVAAEEEIVATSTGTLKQIAAGRALAFRQARVTVWSEVEEGA